MKRFLVVTAAAIAGLHACAGVEIPHPAPEDARDVPLERLKEGRSLYVAKCSGCHALYPPAAYSDDDWRRFVGGMSEKARVAPSEQERIILYLTLLNRR